MKKTDLLTGESFDSTRINQKFANPGNRIKYYNNKASKLRHSNAWVDKPLHKNLCILNELMENKKEQIFHKQYLLGKGITFKINSHFEEYDGKQRNAVYQYIIVPLPEEKIKILKK